MRTIAGPLVIAGLFVVGGAAVPCPGAEHNALTKEEIADGWILLYDGQTLFGWRSYGEAKWASADGTLAATSGSDGWIGTRTEFANFVLKLQYRVSSNGNSGIFFMGLYEVQILDSFENDTYADGQAAAIYGQYPPLVNACQPPGAWQTYDIVFRRPRFLPDGTLEKPARITVFHNGVLVHARHEIQIESLDRHRLVRYISDESGGEFKDLEVLHVRKKNIRE